MTRLSPHGIRSPLDTRNLTEDDRVTYRKWARAWYVAGSAVMIVAIAAGFFVPRSDDAQTARKTQPVGFNVPAADTSHPFG